MHANPAGLELFQARTLFVRCQSGNKEPPDTAEHKVRAEMQHIGTAALASERASFCWHLQRLIRVALAVGSETSDPSYVEWDGNTIFQ